MNQTLKTALADCTYREETTESNKIFDAHCHLNYELIVVYEGTIHIVIEGQQIELHPYEMVLIPPLRYHSVYSVKSGIYRRAFILFEEELIPTEIREDLKTISEAEPFYSHPILKPTLDLIPEIMQDAAPAKFAPLVESVLTEIFYHLIMHRTARVFVESNTVICQISNYIDRHIHEKILLDDIANHLYLSKSTLCHLFQKNMNISVKQYILQKKVFYAADLIRGGMPATEVSKSIGYDNYANFYKVYKKFFPHSPSKKEKKKKLPKKADD